MCGVSDDNPTTSSLKPPCSSEESSQNGQNGARKRGKVAQKEREASARLHILESHRRLNFLHQAAVHLSYQSSGLNDGYAKLSRRYAKLFRDVHKTERIKVMPDVIQTFCKKCKQLLIAKVERCKLDMVQKKIVQRKCLLCGYSKNYEMNRDYLSRNQRFWKEQEETSTTEPKAA